MSKLSYEERIAAVKEYQSGKAVWIGFLII